MVLSWVDSVRPAAGVSHKLPASDCHRTKSSDGWIGVLVRAEEGEDLEVNQEGVIRAFIPIIDGIQLRNMWHDLAIIAKPRIFNSRAVASAYNRRYVRCPPQLAYLDIYRRLIR